VERGVGRKLVSRRSTEGYEGSFFSTLVDLVIDTHLSFSFFNLGNLLFLIDEIVKRYVIRH
jgi:hypothetical protein